MNLPSVNRDLIAMAQRIRREHPYQPNAEFHTAAEYFPEIILEIVRRHKRRQNAQPR